MNYPPPKLNFFKNCLWVNNYWCYVAYVVKTAPVTGVLLSGCKLC